MIRLSTSGGVCTHPSCDEGAVLTITTTTSKHPSALRRVCVKHAAVMAADHIAELKAEKQRLEQSLATADRAVERWNEWLNLILDMWNDVQSGA